MKSKISPYFGGTKMKMDKKRLENNFTRFSPTDCWKVNTVRDCVNPEEFYLEVAHGGAHQVNLVQHGGGYFISLDKDGAIALQRLLGQYIGREDKNYG